MNNVLVIGAARSGVAAANFLAGRGIGVTINDAKPEKDVPLASKLHPRVRRLFGSHDLALLTGVDTVVLSPGVPSSLELVALAKRRGIPVISEIELAFRHLSGTAVAVTGTNGKSTTTALIGEIFRVAGRDPIVAGNIGEPLIAALDTRPRVYVIELSSFQLETVESFRANIALLLNITPDHLDRYTGIEDYAAAKQRIFRNQTADDFAIVNGDDRRLVSPPTKARVLRFSSSRELAEGAFVSGADLVVRWGGSEGRIPREALAISGTANAENALAAWLAARVAGISDQDVERAFRSFRGLPHRMVLVRELGGVRFINDSKGTNVDATLKSLEGQPAGRVILILGGKDKSGEFERLRPLVGQKVRSVLTIGAAAPRITAALDGAAPIVPCETMQVAVSWARSNARKGETVLLSPACASFDQYGNFEERGRHFEELVRGLS